MKLGPRLLTESEPSQRLALRGRSPFQGGSCWGSYRGSPDQALFKEFQGETSAIVQGRAMKFETRLEAHSGSSDFSGTPERPAD